MDNKLKSLGRFRNEDDAAYAYDKAVRGKAQATNADGSTRGAQVNFPHEQLGEVPAVSRGASHHSASGVISGFGGAGAGHRGAQGAPRQAPPPAPRYGGPPLEAAPPPPARPKAPAPPPKPPQPPGPPLPGSGGGVAPPAAPPHSELPPAAPVAAAPAAESPGLPPPPPGQPTGGLA